VTEQEIFEGIARKDNRTFLYLYNKYQGSILNMVRKNNGNEEDAHDIFQEGLIALWTNISQGKFQQGKAKISTYLYALCRNIWISRLRKKKYTQPIEDNPKAQAAEVEDLTEYHERINKLEQDFEKLGEACKKLLTLFYYQKASLQEIADSMDLTTKTAKNTKYRCMNKLRAIYQPENQAS
jgi:RNA polymerase sigma factor (sigma-70 family)